MDLVTAKVLKGWDITVVPNKKESFRWLKTMNETQKRVPEGMRVLTVCDREGDFYELFSEAADLGTDFLIRIVQNRMIDDGKKGL